MAMNSAFLGKVSVWESSSMQWMQRKRSPVLTRLLIWITRTGNGKTWFSVAIALNVLSALGVRFIPEQQSFLRAMLCALLAWVLGTQIKKWVGRARPFECVEGLSTAVSLPTCRSFPSGHAASAVAFFAGLLLIGHPWAAGVGVWASLVAFSRFYLGVHFITDLLGGAVLGVFCGAMVLPISALLAG